LTRRPERPTPTPATHWPGGKPRAPQVPRKAPPGEVRLIGGQWKRSKLPVAVRAGLRPTPDRVRETLFNWLGQDLNGWRVLDAFAGTGALGFEAASRGAAEVLLLEQDPALVASLEASRTRLGASQLTVLRADALAWLRRCPAERFELILLDPPFDQPALALAALAAAVRALVPGGCVYMESAEALAVPAGLVAWRSLRAGAVNVQVMQRSTTETAETAETTASTEAP